MQYTSNLLKKKKYFAKKKRILKEMMKFLIISLILSSMICYNSCIPIDLNSLGMMTNSGKRLEIPNEVLLNAINLATNFLKSNNINDQSTLGLMQQQLNLNNMNPNQNFNNYNPSQYWINPNQNQNLNNYNPSMFASQILSSAKNNNPVDDTKSDVRLINDMIRILSSQNNNQQQLKNNNII